MINKPIIGIVLDTLKNSKKYTYSSFPWYAIRQCYSKAIIKAQGIPIHIPCHVNPNEILKLVHGLIIPGSDFDIHPKFYGQKILSKHVVTNIVKTKFEINLVKQALIHNIPILGICNGMQVINTVLGGTLIQHIPAQINSSINHLQPNPRNIPSHYIFIKDNSMLANLTTNLSIKVNSSHHQAIDTLGKGLNISAYANDGIIEAIESNEYNFLFGVQWHCEYKNSNIDSNLFKKLIAHSYNFMYN